MGDYGYSRSISAKKTLRQEHDSLLRSARSRPPLILGTSGAGLAEAGGGEVSIEREGVLDLHRSHQREASRVDEGIRAFVVLAEPRPCAILELGRNWDDLESRGAVQRIQESDRAGMPDPAAEEGLRLSSNVVRVHHSSEVM